MESIQQWWSNEIKYVFRSARGSKDPMEALFEMYKRYDALDNTEREQINKLLIRWVQQADVNSVSRTVVNSDGSYSNDQLRIALAIIEDYNITIAIPAIEKLAEQLKVCVIPGNPQGYHEREGLLRILKKLKKS